MVRARWQILERKSHPIQEKSADYDGVMGGFANLNDLDVNFSRNFMGDLAKMMPKLKFN